eukprot:419097_1
MLFTLIVSTLSCGLVFGADSPAPADPTLCGLPAIQDINLLPNHHGDKQLKYVVRRASGVEIQDVKWLMNIKYSNNHSLTYPIVVPGCMYSGVHNVMDINTTNEEWAAVVFIGALMHMHGEEDDKAFELMLSAHLVGEQQCIEPSQSVTIKNGAVHKPGNNLGRIVMHLIIIVFISVFISVYCGAYYWTKKNKQAQVVNENSTSNV